MSPARPGIRTTPILVGGTLLVVLVTVVVIVRMAALDAQMAQRAAMRPAPITGLASVASPIPTPQEDVRPMPAPEAPVPAEPVAPAAVAIPAPQPQAPPTLVPVAKTEPVPAPSRVVAKMDPLPAEGQAVARTDPVPTPSQAVAKTDPLPAESQASVSVAPPAPHIAKPEAHAPTPPAAPAPPPGPWWPAPRDSFLNLLHAGYLGESPAVVLLFDGEFQSTNGLDQAIAVTRSDGSKVAGAWQIGPNGRTLILPVRPGVYRVDLAPILADTKGQVLGTPMGGPVVVR